MILIYSPCGTNIYGARDADHDCLRG